MLVQIFHHKRPEDLVSFVAIVFRKPSILSTLLTLGLTQLAKYDSFWPSLRQAQDKLRVEFDQRLSRFFTQRAKNRDNLKTESSLLPQAMSANWSNFVIPKVLGLCRSNKTFANCLNDRFVLG